MKRCEKMPSRWDVWGAGAHRWHAFFCPECREARRAGGKLARGAQVFRRALRQEAAPPGLETEILKRLGLSPPESRPLPQSRGGWRRSPWGGRPALSPGAAWGVAGAMALVLLGLATWRSGRLTAPQALSSAPQPKVIRIAKAPVGSAGVSIPPAKSVGSPYARTEFASRILSPASGRDGDLAYLNADAVSVARRWAPLRRDDWARIEAELRRNVRVKDDFVQIPLPRLADATGRQIAAAAESYKREAAIVDARLFRKVSLAFKATALSDLCDHLRSATGITLTAGSSVADEKVTIFCKERPLREVMRQLSRPFAYGWVRSGKAGEYNYELLQDLRSQLVEEELRERDRRAALLALEREIERYRPYRNLTPDEAQARAKTAAPSEKALLEQLAGWGWGPIQMYLRLSNQEMAALRAGETLRFNAEPRLGERPLPPDIARGVLQSFRDWRVARREDGRLVFSPIESIGQNGVPATDSPEARAGVILSMPQRELGALALGGLSLCRGAGEHSRFWWSQLGNGYYATGRSPAVTRPDNRLANKALATQPDLGAPVTVRPEPSSTRRGSGGSGGGVVQPGWFGGAGVGTDARAPPKVTTADALEAIYRATGMPIVADYYTRLYPASEVSVRDARLFDALNQIGDAMRLRWNRDRDWLQFRSTSFYDDRSKEVPNRMLSRWVDSRQAHGFLPLDDLVEIAQLSDAQLDAEEMAEGAKALWGLKEWELASNGELRQHLRYLAGFTPEQRQAAISDAGLAFTKMPLVQQQRFLALAVNPDAAPLQSLEELDGALLRVDYSLPGSFQWGDPGTFHNWTRWVVPVEPGQKGRRVPRPVLRARTRDAVLQALRRLDPQIREAAFASVRQVLGTDEEATRPVPLEAQIFPTELRLTFVYIPSGANAREIRITSSGTTNYQPSW